MENNPFKHLQGFIKRMEQKDYLRSDYLSETEAKTEAEVPVPDRLLPKSKYREIVSRLKLSQKIGLLLWMNREKVLSLGGKERLLYLQEKASFDAIQAGIKFAQRLTKDEKLQSDFIHAARELNRRPQSKRFRTREKRRIGVGYRDKGTLPGNGTSARRKSTEESFVPSWEVPEELLGLLVQLIPTCLTEDGEWVDLTEISEGLRSSDSLKENLHTLLTPL